MAVVDLLDKFGDIGEVSADPFLILTHIADSLVPFDAETLALGDDGALAFLHAVTGVDGVLGDLFPVVDGVSVFWFHVDFILSVIAVQGMRAYFR